MKTNLMDEYENDFRKCGFTAQAINYPLTKEGCEVVALLNGIESDKMPIAWRFAPNSYMKDWLDWLGEEHRAGRPIWNGDRLRKRP